MFYTKKLLNSLFRPGSPRLGSGQAGQAVLGLTFGVLLAGYAVFAFTPPDILPPGGNVAPPINTGSATQVKLGNLFVDGLAVGGGLRLGSFGTLPADCPSNPSKIGEIVYHISSNGPFICTSSGWIEYKGVQGAQGSAGATGPQGPKGDKGDPGPSPPACSADNGGQCYITQSTKSGLDGDLSPGNIRSGVNIFGITGTASVLGPSKFCDKSGDNFIAVPKDRELDPGCSSWCGARGYGGFFVKCSSYGNNGYVSDASYDWNSCVRVGTRVNENNISWCNLGGGSGATCNCY